MDLLVETKYINFLILSGYGLRYVWAIKEIPFPGKGNVF